MKNEAGKKHLNKDKRLRMLIRKVGDLKWNPEKDVFVALLKAIVSQQLSDKAAATIWKRFLALFKEGKPEAKKLLKFTDEKLRSVGLSYSKAGYLKNIARFSIEHSLDIKSLARLDDEMLIDHLVSIKGVGRWTAEMILMFTMERPDILPLDDLGIQNGIKAIYGLSSEKKQLRAEMLEIAENWRPYRTLACLYIWRYKDAGFTNK